MILRAAVLLLSTLLAEVLGCGYMLAEYPPPARHAEAFARRIRETLSADYRGDTDRLRDLHERMARDTADAETARWAHYWRGFARWRRSMNLLNEEPGNREALADLRIALRDFERAATYPELFADAQSARAACFLMLGANSGSPDSLRAALLAYAAPLEAAVGAEPDNPRVLWVQSGSTFYRPAAKGGGPDVAIALMERGLARARAERRRPHYPYAPAWGEAEHQLNLAWAWSSRPDPDRPKAELHAREALRLVPDWRYVRVHLLPKILELPSAATP